MNIYSWNPRRYRAPGFLGRFVTYGPRINNFGDLLGPLIVNEVRRQLSLGDPVEHSCRTLYSVGSVLHFASDNDYIWGTGRNGKIADEAHKFSNLRVSAVRGPKTAQFLADRGVVVPPVYGDPGLLVPHLFPETLNWTENKTSAVSIVPNLNEWSAYQGRTNVINPVDNVWEVIRSIAGSEMVVGSSLHGIVIAEALGVPARLVVPKSEPLFKYQDYFEGTGRHDIEFAASVEEALAMGGAPALQWQPNELLQAFPRHLWIDAKSQTGTINAI